MGGIIRALRLDASTGVLQCHTRRYKYLLRATWESFSIATSAALAPQLGGLSSVLETAADGRGFRGEGNLGTMHMIGDPCATSAWRGVGGPWYRCVVSSPDPVHKAVLAFRPSWTEHTHEQHTAPLVLRTSM